LFTSELCSLYPETGNPHLGETTLHFAIRNVGTGDVYQHRSRASDQ